MRTIAFISLAISAAIAGLVLLIAYPAEVKQLLNDDEDLYRIIFQFLLFIVFGGVLSYIYRILDYERDLRDKKKLVQREFYVRALQAYNDTKRIRRLFRALAVPLSGESTIDGLQIIKLKSDVYDTLMSDLQRAQLALESLKREAEVIKDVLGHHHESITRDLSQMESYLRRVLEESEKPKKIQTEDNVNIKQLDTYNELGFVHGGGRHNYRKGFVEPADHLRNSLVKLVSGAF